MTSRKPSVVGTLTYVLFGLIVWAIHFTALYAGHTIVCSQDFPPAIFGWFAFTATIVALGALGAFVIWRRTIITAIHLEGFPDLPVLNRLAWLSIVLSAVAMLWGGTTALLIAGCVLGR